MMTKLREFSKVFIVIVALSFMGLLVFEWGADYSGRAKVDDTVGEVNSNKLSYKQFNELYQQLFQNQKAQAGDKQFKEEEMQMIRNQVWEQFIQRTLFQEEMEKLGISVSDSEVVYQVYNHPLEDFKRHPSFQTNGIFDIQKYRASFSSDQIPWKQIEEMYRQQIPFIKLQNIITNTVRVTEDEVLDEFHKTNLKAKVEYLVINHTDFNEGLTVDEAETEKFYNENKEDYTEKEKRELSYIVFPIAITAKDTLDMMDDFNAIRDRLAKGEDFGQLALTYSEDPSVQTNRGDLGYFERGAMVKEFSDAAFNAAVGDLIGPVKTNFGFHLIKVEDKKIESGKEKVKASHILLKIVAAPSTVEAAAEKAGYFAEDAKENGFTALAQADSLPIKNTGLFGESSGFIPGVGRNFSVLQWAFTAKENDISGIYQLDEGYAVFQLSAIQAEGYRKLEDVKRLVENRVKLEKAKTLAKEHAVKLEAGIKANQSFATIKENDASKKSDVGTTPLFSLNSSIPRVGKSVEFSATAFALEVGEISGLIETDRAFYYEKTIEKTTFDSSAFNAQKSGIKSRLLSQKRNKVFNNWYESLKENADITDNRKRFGL
jgi:peptidyl-prolyl cis-trans isomerase D